MHSRAKKMLAIPKCREGHEMAMLVKIHEFIFLRRSKKSPDFTIP